MRAALRNPGRRRRASPVRCARRERIVSAMNSDDPVASNPEHYRVLFENEHVRVLDYTDTPGTRTTPHSHPNSVMVTLSDFDRRLHTPAGSRDVTLTAAHAMWLPAQRHAGENIGSTPTHVIFIELKGAGAGSPAERSVGPVTP